MAFAEYNDGTKIHYISKGKGHKNIIFIHGNLANTIWWEKTLDALPEEYTGYAIDLPGSGLSAETGKRHTIEYFVEIVEDFRIALGLEKFFLVGHSMGGGVAQLYTLTFPNRVEKLVLLDSMSADGFHVLYDRGIDRLEEMMKNIDILGPAIRIIAPKCTDEELIKRAIEAASKASKQVFLEQPVTMHEANWMDRLQEIKCPVLYLHGELDNFCPKDGAERTSAKIPNCTFKYLEGLGHSPQAEDPQLFNKELFDFLKD